MFVQVVYSEDYIVKSYVQNDELNRKCCGFVRAGVTIKRIGVAFTEFL